MQRTLFSSFSRLLAIPLVAAAACSGPAVGTSVVPTSGTRSPSDFAGFPDASTDESIWVEAQVVADPGAGQGPDLAQLASLGVLPVALRLGHLDASWERARLSRDTFDAHLYLQDGTVLGWIGPKASLQPEPVRRAEGLFGLEFSLLPAWSSAEEGYLFFSLGDGVTIEGERARIRDAGGSREVALNGSLITFRVETATGSRVVRVGLRAGGSS